MGPSVKNDAVSQKHSLRKRGRRADRKNLAAGNIYRLNLFTLRKLTLDKYIYYIYNVYIKINNSFHKEKRHSRRKRKMINKELKISNYEKIYEEVMSKFMKSYNKLVDLVEDLQECELSSPITEEDLNNISLIDDILQMINAQIKHDEEEGAKLFSDIYKATFIDGIAWSNGIDQNDEYYEKLWS